MNDSTFLKPNRQNIGASRKRVRTQGWFLRRGIKVVMWDLDDTIVDSVPVFILRMGEYIDSVSSSFPLIERSVLLRSFEQENDAAFFTHKVNPNRWDFVAKQMAKIFPGEVWTSELHHLYKIYETLPNVFPDALVVVRELRALGIPQALVSHAREEWTQFKLEGLNLTQYFDAGVFCTNIDNFKTSEEWGNVYQKIGIEPREAVVFGDSVKGDAMANHEIGGKNIFLIRRPNLWHITAKAEGALPETVTEINELTEFLRIVRRVESSGGNFQV